jgi:hypothetical protein
MAYKLLTYAVMLDNLIAAYVQFVIRLIEIQKVINQELKCVCIARLPQSYRNEISQKYECKSPTFLLY